MLMRRRENMPRKIILDVDTGSDDALAIMLAYMHEDIDLVAVCTVNGNQPLEKTTENTLRVRDLLKADFPVYKGAASSLCRNLVVPRTTRASNVDAYDEMGNKIHIHKDLFDLPASTRGVEDMPAALFYVDYLSKTKEPITLVPVGPLTNVALALLIKPEIVDNIEEIVIMGGGCNIANVTSSAEFNIWDDPEAALRVLHCGAKITMVPLDATHTAYISQADSDELKKMNNPASLFASSQLDVRIMVHDQCQPLEHKGTCALHDPLCIAYLIDSRVLTDVRFCNVEVALSGFAEGQTIVDQRAYQDNRNVHYAFAGDPKLFSKILLDTFRSYKW